MGEAARKKATRQAQAAEATAAGEVLEVEVSERTCQRLQQLEARRALFQEVLAPSLQLLQHANQEFEQTLNTVLEAKGVDLARQGQVTLDYPRRRLVVHFEPAPPTPEPDPEPAPERDPADAAARSTSAPE